MELNGYRLLALCELEVNWEFHSVLLLCWCAVISAAVITYFWTRMEFVGRLPSMSFNAMFNQLRHMVMKDYARAFLLFGACAAGYGFFCMISFDSLPCLSMMSYHELF